MDKNLINRNNNFDIIRLIAALQVALLHLKIHMGIETQYEWVFKILRFFPGVPIFFTVSGFLIAAAWSRCPDVKKYSKNRFLRIYPGLCVCFILTFAMLTYVGLINAKTVFSKQAMIWYFFSLFTIYPNITPPMLKQLQTGDPNGSLWTLPIELQFYIVLPILLILIIKFQKKGFLLVIGIVSALLYICKPALIANFPNPIFWKFITCSVVIHLWNFFVGVFLFVYWKQIRHLFVEKALWWFIVYASVYFILLTIDEAGFLRGISSVFLRCLLGCLVISFAFTQTAIFNILKGFDISYGIYIYHMPIVNAVIEKGFSHNQVAYYGVLGIVILFAAVSWNYIERPCLRLKYR